DFRGSTLGGWKSDGRAFGDHTTLGTLQYTHNGSEVVALSAGMASSQSVGTGVFGALRSPNFTIEKDFIGVQARGKKSSVRIIIDNFQLISYPIFGDMDRRVNSTGWKDLTFDVKFWRGHKAYIEIIPGYFNQHVYKLPPDAFIEARYAIAFNGKWAEPSFSQ